MSWFCSCGLLNNGLNTQCAASRTDKHIEHNQVSANTPDTILTHVALRELTKESSMTPNEELFAKYYNKGKLLVIDMDDTALREHREALREIATEAKAQLVAADDEIRERGAKKKLKDKEWLVSVDTDRASTDAINAVAARKGRMSKLDKLRKDLEKSGLSDEVIKEMMSKLERTATEKNLKTITFHKAIECANCKHSKDKHADGIGTCSVCDCKQFRDENNLGVVQVESKEPPKPFDPSSLFGK